MKELTYVTECDLKAKDVKKLRLWLKKIKDTKEAEFIIVEDNGTVTVEWDGKRIISYWYPSFLIFLKNLAKYIDGEVLLDVESDTQSANIHFYNGICYIDLGIMFYRNFTVHEMLELFSCPDLPAGDEIIKSRISVNK
jgi:hypothetical protein